MFLVDIDGTLAATGELLQERRGIPLEKYPAPLPEGFWESPEGMEIFRDAEPLPGSVEVLRGLAGVAYVTLRPVAAGFVTARWLQRHGYPDGPVYFCRSLFDKGELARSLATTLVFEDDPLAPSVYSTPLVLIARPYNAFVPGNFRVSWKEILEKGAVFFGP